jgi:pimeloyl-ACP methyl ester carboxylesterase
LIRLLRLGAACALLALAAGCATPVGVDRVDPRTVQRELLQSALTGDQPSAPTRELLTRLDLRDAFQRDPDGVLATLHQGFVDQGDLDRLYALAELSFLQAERTGRRDHALAAAVYAYTFLFGGAEALHRFDPRVQVARHLYNRGLSLGLRTRDGRFVAVENVRYELPFGTLDVRVPPDETIWAGWRLERFASATDFRVRGLQNRYRRAGVGAPLTAALGDPVEGRAAASDRFIPPRLQVPVTAFLRIDDPRAQIATGRLAGSLELFSEEERAELEVGGEIVPLELERSSAFASMLEGSAIWDFGLAGFRLGDYLPGATPDQLVMLRPYRPGLIPVVLVHGTFSSPATWAELINELENDPEISSRYQPWMFIYNTGNPIGWSGGLLAETLRNVVAELDPAGADPALRRMVVVGHSQGGLLTKLMVVDSGDRFWANISRRPFDEVELERDSRAVLQRSLFFEPLPFVSRVVFMSTPHGGSYLSDFRLTSWISRLVKAPASITKLMVDLATLGGDELYLRSLDRMPTSLDNMASRNPFLRTLADLPIASGVVANSIIAVRGSAPPDGIPPANAGDGVVRFRSAHIPGVESEKIVWGSGHSVQMTQPGIQELRRILLVHAGAAP